jgi:preprotein translocase subunit SecE
MKIGEFLAQVRTELAKIEWPSLEEFVGSTIITLLLILFFTLYIGGVDRIIMLGAKYVFSYVS